MLVGAFDVYGYNSKNQNDLIFSDFYQAPTNIWENF